MNIEVVTEFDEVLQEMEVETEIYKKSVESFLNKVKIGD